MDDPGFRLRQVLADLERVPGSGSVQDPATTLFATGGRSNLMLAALSKAMLDVFETGAVDPFLAEIWEMHLPTVRKAPSSIRAALMNGIGHLRRSDLIELSDGPSASDLVTDPLERLARRLIRIGRRMTPEEADMVARADYGCDIARHRAALDVLLRDPRLAYPDGEVWFPAEVVELVSYVPGKPGHIPCLAIVLLDALRNEDRCGDASFRLERQARAVSALDPSLRDVFFAAFRHLYESDPDWSPAVPAPFTLPWVSLS